MAWSFISATGYNIASGTDCTVSLPAGYAAGDMLFIITSGWNTPTTPSGWTALSNAAGQQMGLFYKRAIENDSSVTFTGVPSTINAAMVCYRGLKILDKEATPSGYGILTSRTTTSQTTTEDNELVVSVYNYGVYDPFNFISSYPSGTTTRLDLTCSGTVAGILLVDENKATAGATTGRTAQLGNAGGFGAASFSFKSLNNSGFFGMM